MKKFAILAFVTFVTFVTFGSAQSQAQVADHASMKILSVVSAPVVHPKRTLKQIAGSVLFAAEPIVDVVHLGFDGLDKSFSALDQSNQYFGVLYVTIDKLDDLSAKADSGLESAEQYFFQTSN